MLCEECIIDIVHYDFSILFEKTLYFFFFYLKLDNLIRPYSDIFHKFILLSGKKEKVKIIISIFFKENLPPFFRHNNVIKIGIKSKNESLSCLFQIEYSESIQ